MPLRYYEPSVVTISKCVNGMIYATDRLLPVQSFPAAG